MRTPSGQWITEAVLLRLDTPQLYAALTAESRPERSGMENDLHDDLARKRELHDAYAKKLIGTVEFYTALQPLTDRIQATELALARSETSLSALEYAGRGDDLRCRWEELSFGQRRAVIQAVLDHLTIRPGVGGLNRFDERRVAATGPV